MLSISFKYLNVQQKAEFGIFLLLSGGSPSADDETIFHPKSFLFSPNRLILAKNQHDGSIHFIYQLKITLRDSKPSIWRRVEVSADTSFYLLHCIIQGAMGWTNSHLHQFAKDEKYYGIPSKEDFFEVKDERKFKLSDLLHKEKDWIRYEYDFGDGWAHRVELEKILHPETGVTYPRIVKGKSACPPEDCGGVWGYRDLVEVLKNPKHPEHQDMLDWLGLDSGDDLDATAFDLDTRQKEMEEMYAWGKKMKGNEMDGIF